MLAIKIWLLRIQRFIFSVNGNNVEYILEAEIALIISINTLKNNSFYDVRGVVFLFTSNSAASDKFITSLILFMSQIPI